MADPTDTVDDDVLDTEDEVKDEPTEEVEEVEPAEGGAEEDKAEEDALTVSFGDEPEAEHDDAPATPAIRQIRQAQRDAVKALRQKERELDELRAQLQQPAATDPGAEPDPDGYEMWTDEGKAKFKADWAGWNTKKQQAESAKAEAQRKRQAEQESWNRTLAEYGTKKQAIKAKAPDFDEAEEVFKENFNEVQQGLVVHCAADSALMVYALGKSPSKMRALSEIKDPAKFAVKLGELQATMKVSSKKSPPPPERVPRANVSGNTAGKGQLERLQTEARKTGDYSAYFAAKSKMKTKA
jgi:hypothetical protein